MLNLKVVACGVAIGALALTTFAQPGGKDTKQPGAKAPEGGRGDRGQGGMRGMEPLSADKAKAAWDLEANAVASRLKLTADQTKSLVTAYENSRTSQQAAMEKARKDAQDSGDRQGMRKAMEEVNKSEREKFTKAVTSSISGESGTKAAAALSAFNPVADRMVDTISGFKLDAAKQTDALNAIETFVGTQAKNMGPDGDPEARKGAREALTASLKKDLSDEQMKKFEESLPGGGGRGQGRGRGPGGGDGEKPPKDK